MIDTLVSIEVIEKTEDEAVIFLELYNLKYKLKKDDWNFVETLSIISKY
jgi:thiamine pyrophosphokinase